MPDKTNPEGKPTHRATYARDKQTGRYNIRVVGPNANEWAGAEVTVETKSGDANTEKLEQLLWSGPDKDPETKELTGRKAALYSFEPRPKEVTEKPVW